MPTATSTPATPACSMPTGTCASSTAPRTWAASSGGANDGAMFAPNYIENKLKFFPQIKEAVAFGHEREQVCAFINIDFEAVGNWAERRGLAYGGYVDLAGKPEVLDAGGRLHRARSMPTSPRTTSWPTPRSPLPGPAQGAGRRRRRAHAHAQGAARLHRRQVRGAGRCALRRQERAVHRDAGEVRGRPHGVVTRHAEDRRCEALRSA